MYLYNIKKYYILQYYMLTYNTNRYILYNIKGNKHNIYILREEGMRMRYNKYDVIYGEFPDRDGSI